MTAAELPPVRVIAAALRKTTGQLALELHAPTANAPDWTEFEWNIARAVATMQGISGLLARRLRWSGPVAWRDFLATQLDHSRRRDAIIGQLIVDLDAQLRARGIAAVTLKGAALRALALYAPGERPMADVDLLVQPPDLQATHAAVLALGYQHTYTNERHSIFDRAPAEHSTAFGEHENHPLKIEVHTAIGEALPYRRVDISDTLFPAGAPAGCNPYRNAAALMRHLLLHAAGNMRAHALRLIQLCDIARLAARFGPQDWTQLLSKDGGNDSPGWMLPPLTLTASCFPGTIPAEFLDRLREHSPGPLRRAAARATLAIVSWSNPRVHAFPGIGWALSPGEAMRFAASRIFPRRAELANLEFTMRAQPGLQRIPWYQQSHARRMLRWLFSRPPRVQTMMTVRAAFESNDMKT